MALRKKRIRHRQLFACDKEPYVRILLRANCESGVEIYEDLLERDNVRTPKAELYVAGFPCQPFSSAGKKRRWDDDRAQLYCASVAAIRCGMPRVALVENSANIKEMFGGGVCERHPGTSLRSRLHGPCS